uniref:Nose resistant to fluoxetine protein 6 n=1 Tax=Schistocephalus solidus TaxID=70667 RepID=A0A0X3NQH5_SCHSO
MQTDTFRQALNHTSTKSRTTVHCRREKERATADVWKILALLCCSVLGTLLVASTIIEIYIYFIWQSQLCQNNFNDESQMIEVFEGEISSQTEGEALRLLEGDASEQTYQKYRSGWIRARTFTTLLLCFSPIENARKIFSSQNQSHRLACLHGFRSLTMAWIVLGHTFAWSLLYSNNALFFLREQSQDWRSQIIFGAAVAVDTFFFMSGLLTVYRSMPQLSEMQGFGKKTRFWIWFAFQRFIRITPLWLFVIIIFLGFIPSANDGPLYDTLDMELGACRRNWWAIFVNNFVHEDDMCLPWTWYLSNEMQFSVILAPIFLTLVQWRPWLGHLFVVSLVASGIGSVAYSTLLYKMPPSFLGALTPGFFVFYVRPYNRWGPYAIGLFTGWLLLTPCVKVKTWVQKDWKRGLLVSTLGFSLALLIMLTAIYYLYGELSGSASPITVQQSAAYNALIRVVWSIALAIIVMLCANGLAGPINAFLSWDLFVKFGRITFGVYLVHPIVLLVLFGSALQPAIIENLSMIVNFIGCLVLSASVSFALSLAIESPLLAFARCF